MKKAVNFNEEKKKLEDKIKKLEIELKQVRENKFKDYINSYIDRWYENNKEDIDIGNIKIGGILKVDVMPDELEKHIYKKVFRILYSLITDLKQ